MSIHAIGILGLVLVFAIGTLRPVNLGALALAATFIVAVGIAGETPADALRGFPVDLLVLLVAVTWLFALAARNGTIDWIVAGAAHLARGRRALLPWIVFAVAAVPTMAGALGSAGVALIAPIALRLAERTGIDRRLVALMVLHGAACGNFSPINVLGGIVYQGAERSGVQLDASTLFLGNVACNVLLGVVVYLFFGGHRLARAADAVADTTPERSVVGDVAAAAPPRGAPVDRMVTLAAVLAVAVGTLCFGINIGIAALVAALALHLLFPRTSRGAERDIAWDVVLLVCGIVTYVVALQRLGTVDAIGARLAALDSPMLGALLLCAVGAVTSAFASSAGILGAMMLLAAPFLAQGGVDATGFIVALAISATVVDSCPFSTAGALVVAHTRVDERERVYRCLLVWGGVMVITAPPLTWLLFIVAG